jgi:hypothetical protein
MARGSSGLSDKSAQSAHVVAGLVLLAMPVSAQWKNLPMDGVPLGPDGKPNMSAPAPRTSDGKADLSCNENEKSREHMGRHIK